jgi:ribosomal protein S18 acetylase RimI-like enzyme
MERSDLASLARVPLTGASRVAALLARAFQDDPLMSYAIPDATERRRVLPRVVELNVRYGCWYGEVYATPGYDGAATWLPPGQAILTPWRMLRAGMFTAPLRIRWPVLRRLAVAGVSAAALHDRQSLGPHWYLSQIGVEPSSQRQGVASRLLRPMLARIDASALPCYLDTEYEPNVMFYQRFGFQVVGIDGVTPAGLRIWGMLRAARPPDG